MSLFDSAVLAASWRGFLIGLGVVTFILVCLLLMGVILLQKGRGGGLSSAFGGAMGSSPFGTKTGDVFTWITVVLAGLFLLIAVLLNRFYSPATELTAEEKAAQNAPATPGTEQGGASEGGATEGGATEGGATEGGATEEHIPAPPSDGAAAPTESPAPPADAPAAPSDGGDS